MALDALGIPLDIPWRRIAWSRGMLHRKNAAVPPKWKTSLTVYAHALPLAETEAEYPDDRVVYFKLSASITGWTLSEDLPTTDELEEELDDWQTDAWDHIHTNGPMALYQPCLAAIAQMSIYPSAEEATDDTYPYFIDFEPKKRELYETVTETGEVLSGSANRVSTQKGNTSTRGLEASVTGNIATNSQQGGQGGQGGQQQPPLASATLGGSYSKSDSYLQTTDVSTDRRESESRTTQLSQMYQLFNGYHPGTNRAVFALFARPHVVSRARQLEANLINGDRKLEGIQEMFLVALVPRTLTGICVDAWIDTAHKPSFDPGHSRNFTVTRRLVAGCVDFDGDAIVLVPPEAPPTEPRQVISGEGELDPGVVFRSKAPADYAKEGERERIDAADTLNQLQVQLRQRVLSFAASNMFTPVDVVRSATFQALGYEALRDTSMSLEDLMELEYLTTEQKASLEARGIKSSAELFAVETDDKTVADVRQNLWLSVLAAVDAGVWPSSAEGMAEAASGEGTWNAGWRFEDVGGGATAAWGGADLTAVSTPAFRLRGAFPGDFAVGFDSTSDSFIGADMFDSDGSTDVAIYLCARLTASSGFQVLAGKGMTSGQPGWLIAVNYGVLMALVTDGTTNVISVGPSGIVDGQWHDFLFCIDRTADKIQVFVDNKAGSDQSSVANATAANSDGFFIGASASGGIGAPTGRVAFAAVATSGVAGIKANAHDVLSGIRASTGRPPLASPVTERWLPRTTSEMPVVTPTSIYLFDEPSGSLIDHVGSHNLSVGGSPTFRSLVDYRYGTKYGANGDYHRADVHAPGSDSIIYGCLFKVHTTITGQNFIMGSSNGADRCLFMGVNSQAAGTLRAVAWDGTTFQAVSPSLDCRGKVLLGLVQVDRAAGLLRFRLSSQGVAPTETSAAIPSGALSSATHYFGFGDFVSSATADAMTPMWAFVARGSQTEGATILASISQRLGI